MVKGVTKRVVVVRCPDTKFFEQAIFMIRDDAVEGMNPEALLEEACRVADGYIRENVQKRRHRWPWLLAGGILLSGLICCALWLSL